LYFFFNFFTFTWSNTQKITLIDLQKESIYHHLTALKKGDQESFKWVYYEYHSIIYYYSLKIIQLQAMAEEATADVFIKLWEKRAIIDPDQPIKALLYKIAKDTAYNYLKKIASNERLKQQYLACYPVIDLKDGELLFMEKEELAAVEQIIETLPPKRLAIFKMRYYEGKDNQAIAQQLEISINTVKVHLAKARLYLKQQLSLRQEVYLLWFWVFIEFS